MTEIAINPGPPARANVSVWRDPRDWDRLTIQRRLNGCLIFVAVPLLVIAARLERSILAWDRIWWQIILGAILGGVGSVLLFGRTRLVIDRKERTLSSRMVLLASLERSLRSIASATAVRIDEHFRAATSDDDSPSTTFSVRLEFEKGGETVELARAGVWERLVAIAESVSTFLSLPLYDYVVDTLREPDEMDIPIQQREKRQGKLAPEPAEALRCNIEIDGAVATITFPPPDARTIYLMAALVGLFWTLPIFFMGNIVVSLLPLVALAWSWFHIRFGLRSVVEVAGSTLRVVRRGILIDRVYEFPSDELEDLAVRTPEWGGSRNVVAQMTEGYLIARSDLCHARFGWGLSKRELEWLRGYILTALEPPKVAVPRRIPEEDVPVGAPSWLAPFGGLLVGALAARVFGGRLEICVAAPFLEHVLNIGGLLGLVVASWVAGRRKGTFRLVAWGCVVLLAGAVFYRDYPLLQPYPTFDERYVAGMKTPPTSFWVGWTIVAAIANSCVAAVALAIAGPFRSRRNRRQPAPPASQNATSTPAVRARSAPDPAKQERNSRIALFVFGLPFFAASLFVFYLALSAESDDRAMSLLAASLFLFIALALMQVWRLVPQRYWPKGIDWNAMIGVLAASGAGLFIIGASIFGDDADMSAPRVVVGAAGSVFLFAGIAILPQAIPRARFLEWVSRICVSLLLTGFAIVAFWAVIDGAYIFVLGLLLTGGLAIASWISLIREALRARSKP